MHELDFIIQTCHYTVNKMINLLLWFWHVELYRRRSVLNVSQVKSALKQSPIGLTGNILAGCEEENHLGGKKKEQGRYVL